MTPVSIFGDAHDMNTSKTLLLGGAFVHRIQKTQKLTADNADTEAG